MVELFVNSGDPDQMLYSAASDFGLHCLPLTLLGVSRLQLINKTGSPMFVLLSFFCFQRQPFRFSITFHSCRPKQTALQTV